MWLCNHCETANSDKDKRCVVCDCWKDSVYKSMQFCTNCGTKYRLTEDSKYCIHCGKKL